MKNQFPGLLSDQQIQALITSQKGIQRIAQISQRLNTIIVEQDLKIRPLALSAHEAGRFWHEIDGLLFAHDLAMAKLRQQANAEQEKLAA